MHVATYYVEPSKKTKTFAGIMPMISVATLDLLSQTPTTPGASRFVNLNWWIHPIPKQMETHAESSPEQPLILGRPASSAINLANQA